MKLNITLYWKSIVDYYYSNDIQDRYTSGSTSIWEWLGEDYDAERYYDTFGWGRYATQKEFLRFKSDTDLVAFKLKFSKVCLELI